MKKIKQKNLINSCCKRNAKKRPCHSKRFERDNSRLYLLIPIFEGNARGRLCDLANFAAIDVGSLEVEAIRESGDA